jgi:D-glycero-D-manno-heptose 1,7-bisphosphate phosphatase
MPDLIAEAVTRIDQLSPDLVAVTGDLVDHPFYGMHDPHLISLSEKDLRLTRELFSGLTCPVAFLHGNHDHPGAFARAFGDLPMDVGLNGCRVVSFLDHEVSGNFPQRLGHERTRFETVMADGDPCPQIHLQHYLIHPERNEGYPHTYMEAASLREALQSDPRVRLVLSGHYHRGEPLQRVGHVAYATAPAFVEPPHPFRIYSVTDGDVTQVEHALDEGSQDRRPRPAVFLDRDGTLNPQPGYRTGPEDYRLMDGVGEALASLRSAGYALVIVSNQTAVGQGYVTAETVGAVNDRMAALLSPFGVELDGVYCRYGSPRAILPSHRTDFPETKPDPAMLHEAAENLGLDLAASYIVGDRRSDLLAGRNAGCLGAVLVKTGGGTETLAELQPGDADFVADDLSAAAAWILGQV